MPEIDIFAEDNQVQVRAFIPQEVEVQNYVGSVSVGNVTTLPAGSQATVTNVGDNTHAILDFGLPKGDAGSMWGELAGDLEDQTDLYTILTGLQTAIDAKAGLASPAFTGVPTAPTAVDDTNTTQVATTAFVKNAITNLNNALQTYVQNYVNQAVANVLKIMNWASAVYISPTSSSTYTVPSDGYIYYSNSATSAVGLIIAGKALNIYGGSPIPVKSGVTIRSSSSTTINLWFIPQA